MKKTVFINLLILCQLVSLAQEKYITSEKSVIKHISFQKNSSENYIKAIPNFQISNFLFVDENNDLAIEAEERSFIRFSLLNVGDGIAREVKLSVSLQNPSVSGIEFEEKKELGDIYSMREKQVSIAVSGRPDLMTGVVGIRIDILDQDGTNPDPLELEIPTKKFLHPNIIVANSAFYTVFPGNVEPGKPIYLRTLIQNVGKGTASNVQVDFLLPSECTPVRSNNVFHIGQMNSGEHVELELPFKVSKDFNSDQLHIDVSLSEKYDLYTENKTISLEILETLPLKEDVQLNPLVVADQESSDFQAENLPDIDSDIPKNLVKYSNRLALVIGNQDYEFLPPLTDQNSNQIRDALVFKDYLMSVLGLKEDNIFLLTNVTSDNLANHFQLLSRIATRVNNAEIFVYYSGLGFLDLSTHTPYILPTDARGEQRTPNQNIFDLFQLLSQTRAAKINFFFDASFIPSGDLSPSDKSTYYEKVSQNLAENMIVYSSSGPGQIALPHQDGGHGLFTYHLLKNLKDTQGKLTYAALGDYLSKNVSVESLQVFQREQDPEIFTGSQAFSWWRNLKLNDY